LVFASYLEPPMNFSASRKTTMLTLSQF